MRLEHYNEVIMTQKHYNEVRTHYYEVIMKSEHIGGYMMVIYGYLRLKQRCISGGLTRLLTRL